MNLLCNVHHGLLSPSRNTTEVKGSYQYYHYGCDDVDDRGWGCGYRTLQTLCSWIKGQHSSRDGSRVSDVPTLKAIQQTLADIGDKPSSIIGSKQWIGSVEVGLVLDTLYDVPCKILHISSGSELQDYIPQLMKHFQNFGSPIMMGGSTDNSSKGVMGVGSEPGSLLILDPHYYGPLSSAEPLQTDNWVCWRTLDFFSEDSFYNLCLPQLKSNC